MKRLLVLLTLFMILSPIGVFAENKPQEKTPETQAQETAPVKKNFIIHLKDGGSMKASSYTDEGDTLKLLMSAGYISIDKSAVLSIEEVKAEGDETGQDNIPGPASENDGAKPTGSGEKPVF